MKKTIQYELDYIGFAEINIFVYNNSLQFKRQTAKYRTYLVVFGLIVVVFELLYQHNIAVLILVCMYLMFYLLTPKYLKYMHKQGMRSYALTRIPKGFSVRYTVIFEPDRIVSNEDEIQVIIPSHQIREIQYDRDCLIIEAKTPLVYCVRLREVEEWEDFEEFLKEFCQKAEISLKRF